MRGKVRYWENRILLPYEYLHETDGVHYPPEPVVILGRCNVKQFIEASRLLGAFDGVRFVLNTREAMQEIDHDSRIFPEEYYLDHLFACPVGTVFGFLDPFDHKNMHDHIQSNIYGSVAFENK